MISDELDARLRRLSGVREERAAIDALLAAIDWAPPRILQLMETYPLGGVALTLDEAEDESGLGVDMQWLRPKDIISEAREVYPGIAAEPHRYFPIGACMLGTGDPYFVAAGAEELPVYRIPHTAVGDDFELVLTEIERVAPSLNSFLARARFKGVARGVRRTTSY